MIRFATSKAEAWPPEVFVKYPSSVKLVAGGLVSTVPFTEGSLLALLELLANQWPANEALTVATVSETDATVFLVEHKALKRVAV